jgi:glycosyltransferase involved in cell wall biosynthesis
MSAASGAVDLSFWQSPLPGPLPFWGIDVMMGTPGAAVVVIGRNEGERLIRCFDSIGSAYPVVYVDSGSTDGSVEEARKRDFRVVTLSTEHGFTAARARNAGWRDLVATWPGLRFVQFVDGDCEFAPGWIETAIHALDAEPKLCAAFGRRRERFPQTSVYNALCDDEWNVPIGLVESCGGDVLFRVAALVEAKGYNDDLIAGEEPDLCLRLGQAGWLIRRVDAEMTLHDAAITRFRQQWLRMRRSGHAYAEHVARHGKRAFPSWRGENRRTIIWAFVLPAVIGLLLLGALLSGSCWLALGGLLIALLYPLQIMRLALRDLGRGKARSFALHHGLWLVLGKFAQAGGLLRYWRNRARNRRNSLIEYKG